MNHKSRILLITGLVAACLAVVVSVVVLGGQSPASSASAANDPMAAVKTSSPGLAPAEGEPDLASFQTTRPSPGQVLQAQGPFDDRLVLESLSLDGQAVTGAVRITSDVSDLLELQVLAGFYDESGTLLGTARFEHHLGSKGHNDAGPPAEREEFSIALPDEFKAKTVSAAVGVPVLVNE